MERNAVEELLSGVGVTSGPDKQDFRNMYNYVFDPLVKLPSFEQEGNPNNNTTREPEIKAFLTVFRKHFRNPAPPNLSTTSKHAEAAFAKVLASNSTTRYSQFSADELKDFEADLRKLLQTLEKWIKEVDIIKFRKATSEDAVESFRFELVEKYSFDSMKFYEEGDILRFSNELEAKIMTEFSKEINQKFQKKSERPDWCTALRQELSQFVTEAIEKNTRNHEDWNKKSEAATTKFKKMMDVFLKNHPFGKKQVVDGFRDKAKTKCEVELGLSEIVTTNPLLKSVWDAKVDGEFRNLVYKWKSEGDGGMKSFLEAVKAEGQKAFKDNFNFELEGGELESMFAQVAEIARRNLETAYETPLDKDNMESSYKTSGGSVGIIFKDGYRIVIPANTKLPTKEFYFTATTSIDYQTSATVSIYEGESPHVAVKSGKLGDIYWTAIPLAKQGVQKLDYRMRIDTLGLLTVEWEVRGSGRKQSVQFKTSAWKGTESDDGERQGHYSTNNKRSKGTISGQEEDGASSSKKAKM